MNRFQPEGILTKSATGQLASLASGEYSAVDLAKACIAQAKTAESLHAFLSLDEARILAQANESDKRRKSGKAGRLEGVPVSVKDNICEQGEQVSCASKFLENYKSPYSATVIEKLKAEGAILFGRTNLDEFAMGSSTENSAFGLTRNPHNTDCVPGGSSGGSAASVAAGIVPLSIGSDTGGSIRQPAAFCGIYGMKPTYGRVSRYGLVAFASSLDQIGPFASTVDDIALLLSVLSGYDANDATSKKLKSSQDLDAAVKPFSKADLKKLKVGVQILNDNEAGFDASVIERSKYMVKQLEESGATVVPLQSKLIEYSIPVYYILSTAEASSNLARFDGIRYGVRADKAQNLIDLYVKSRTSGFGPEVKRRILLGTYVLSSGYYDAYYHKAEMARKMIRQEYDQFFSQVDLIVQPTSPTVAFRIGEKASNPISMYQSDLLTSAMNLAGVPSMSIPYGEDKDGMPIGMQITAPHFDEAKILRLAKTLES